MSNGTFLVLNGPNLNLLGVREPSVYGTATLSDVEQLCADTSATLGYDVECIQSNHEGDLIDALHAARGEASGVVINAGGYSHTSIALRDAISAVALPTVELHISNVHAREAFRHESMLTAVCTASIVGAGIYGYKLALEHLAHLAGASS